MELVFFKKSFNTFSISDISIWIIPLSYWLREKAIFEESPNLVLGTFFSLEEPFIELVFADALLSFHYLMKNSVISLIKYYVTVIKRRKKKLGTHSCRAPVMHLWQHWREQNNVYLKYLYFLINLHYKLRSSTVT